jgi:uncharacterized membrane protein YkvA (DUF1232 family)
MKWVKAIKEKADGIKKDTYAIYFAYRDPRLAWGPRLFAACVVAYAFSPIDLIPDFVPILGYLDDLIIIPAGIAISIRIIPPEILADARKKAAISLQEKKPENWVAGILIILAWLTVAFLVLRPLVERFFPITPR